jgi:hypothetical protein
MTLGSAGHDALHANANDDIIAIASKLGKGSSLPNIAGVMRVTNAGTLSTGWGQIVSGDITDGTIATVDMAANAVSQRAAITGVPSAGTQSISVTNTATDITGASFTFTATAGSVLLFLAQCQMSHSVASGRAYITVANGAGSPQWSSPYYGHATANQTMGYYFGALMSNATTGSVTFKLQFTMVDAGTLTIIQFGAALFCQELKR